MSITNQKYPTQISTETATQTVEPSKKQLKAKSEEANSEPLKTITNKTSAAPTAAVVATSTTTAAKTPKALFEQIKQVGDNVRDLKTKKAPKVCIQFLLLYFVISYL